MCVTRATWRLEFLHTIIRIYIHSMTAVYTKYIHSKHSGPNLPNLTCYFMTKIRLLLWSSRLSHRTILYMDINVQGNVLPSTSGQNPRRLRIAEKYGVNNIERDSGLVFLAYFLNHKMSEQTDFARNFFKSKTLGIRSPKPYRYVHEVTFHLVRRCRLEKRH